MIVEHIEQIHRDEGLGYREACIEEGVGYASFMRWRQRRDAGKQLASTPGPRKVEPIDLDELREKIHALHHGNKRTAGAGELYQQVSHAVSRREFNRLVREERNRKKRERNRIIHRVSWKMPRLIWATDDTEYRPDKRYPKAYLHVVEDLGSRYQFDPLVSHRLAHGEEVAAHLARLFEEHGPPLFLKRDNGGNLNHHEVEQILCDYLVIPVNSPCYYPQYNGGVERAQGVLKDRLRSHPEQPHSFLAIQAELDIQALNHSRRAGLGHRTPCQLFTAGLPEVRPYNRIKRREVYETIRKNTLERIESDRYDTDMAWRSSVETWLLEHHFITVHKKG